MSTMPPVPSAAAPRPPTRDPRLFRLGLFALVALALVAGVVFALGGNRWFSRAGVLETYFDESVQGLDVGSKVKYRGVVLGQVTRIGFTYEKYELEGTALPPRRYVLVEAAVRPDLVGIRQAWDDATRVREIAKGLRVRLASQGLTGTAYLEMDYIDPAANPPLAINWQPEYFYVPSARSTVTQIVDAAQDTLGRLQRLDLETTVARTNALLAGLTQAVDAIDAPALSKRAQAALRRFEALPVDELGRETRALVAELRDTNRALLLVAGNPAWTTLTQDLQLATAQVRRLAEDPALPALVARTEQLARRTERLVAAHEGELGEAIGRLRELGDNLNELGDTLRRQPSALLFAPPPPPLERAR